MDNNQNNTRATQGDNEAPKPKKTITTEVKCSKCGNVETVTIELPEEGKPPRVTWTG